jgi:hypothetical protein
MKRMIPVVVRPLSHGLMALMCLLLLSVSAFSQASLTDQDYGSRTRIAAPSSEAGLALSLLPHSDFVIALDVQQAMKLLLPQLQSAAPADLMKFKAELDSFISKTGIDLYQVKSVIVAMSADQLNSRQFKGAILVQGLNLSEEKFASLLRAQNAGFKTFSWQGKNLIVVDEPTAPVKSASAKRGSRTTPKKISSSFKYGDLAMCSLDNYGFVMGDLESVKSTLDAQAGARPLANALLGNLLETTSPSGIVRFSFVISDSLRQQMNETGGAAAAPFATLRGAAGAVSIDPDDGGSTEITVRLRSSSSTEATKLEAALKAFMNMGRSGIGEAESVENKVALQLLDQINLRPEGEDTIISLYLPKAVIDDWKKQMPQGRRLIASRN